LILVLLLLLVAMVAERRAAREDPVLRWKICELQPAEIINGGKVVPPLSSAKELHAVVLRAPQPLEPPGPACQIGGPPTTPLWRSSSTHCQVVLSPTMVLTATASSASSRVEKDPKDLIAFCCLGSLLLSSRAKLYLLLFQGPVCKFVIPPLN
jgi:hypothetical protein